LDKSGKKQYADALSVDPGECFRHRLAVLFLIGNGPQCLVSADPCGIYAAGAHGVALDSALIVD